jgi:hypothetical protein
MDDQHTGGGNMVGGELRQVEPDRRRPGRFPATAGAAPDADALCAVYLELMEAVDRILLELPWRENPGHPEVVRLMEHRRQFQDQLDHWQQVRARTTA